MDYLFDYTLTKRVQNLLDEFALEFNFHDIKDVERIFGFFQGYINKPTQFLNCCLHEIAINDKYNSLLYTEAYSRTLFDYIAYQSKNSKVTPETIKLLNDHYYKIPIQKKKNLIYFTKRNSLSFIHLVQEKITYYNEDFKFPRQKELFLEIINLMNLYTGNTKGDTHTQTYNSAAPIQNLTLEIPERLINENKYHSLTEEQQTETHDIMVGDYTIKPLYHIFKGIFKANINLFPTKKPKKEEADFIAQFLNFAKSISLSKNNKINLFDFLPMMNINMEYLSQISNLNSCISNHITQILKIPYEQNKILDQFMDSIREIKHDGKLYFFQQIIPLDKSDQLFSFFFSYYNFKERENLRSDIEEKILKALDLIDFETSLGSDHYLSRIDSLKKVIDQYMPTNSMITSSIKDEMKYMVDNHIIKQSINLTETKRKIKI